MDRRLSILMAGITMQDDLGIVYLVENAQQFWSELEDVLHFPRDMVPTLSQLDAALRRALTLCATYHELYLQTPVLMSQACTLVLDSELFAFHSERMCEILLDDIQAATDPHMQYIFYQILLHYGRRGRVSGAMGGRGDFFGTPKRWQTVLPLLIDHVRVDVDDVTFDTLPEDADCEFGVPGAPVLITIEARLRSLSVKLLYEVCRVQCFSLQDLRIFPSSFIDYLFDLVEDTRNMRTESFNYAIINLIVALNEQFMVACLKSVPSSTVNSSPVPTPSSSPSPHSTSPPHVHRTTGSTASVPGAGPVANDLTRRKPVRKYSLDTASCDATENRVLAVLTRRLGTSKTFGENVVFMLNRAKHTSEDLTSQLLLLKVLYLLFTTKGTEDFFYTNDLCVLVDVFLRELSELMEMEEDSSVLESLRHTYLRVLHPLMANTQLRDVPYKRIELARLLETVIRRDGRGGARAAGHTTRRLAKRCLNGKWCTGLRSPPPPAETFMREAPTTDFLSIEQQQHLLLTSRSMDNLAAAANLASGRESTSTTRSTVVGGTFGDRSRHPSHHSHHHRPPHVAMLPMELPSPSSSGSSHLSSPRTPMSAPTLSVASAPPSATVSTFGASATTDATSVSGPMSMPASVPVSARSSDGVVTIVPIVSPKQRRSAPLPPAKSKRRKAPAVPERTAPKNERNASILGTSGARDSPSGARTVIVPIKSSVKH